ncbi:beta-1,3-galactosyltransferase 5-like [Pristis pectinata]|uniref:beta-1,3-galactosyltransferase 5-like n=1 Tax=Pristis pectinata TaxID=685728 RepID=UPI00223DCDBF|nr:beta-1,3-galactosyltransferase 5-like [Pristis pectinata]
MHLTSLCGNRLLKDVTVLLMIFCLISVFLRNRDWSRSSAQPPCPSRFNGFSFLMRPAIRCDNSGPFLVLLVTSSSGRFQTRLAIRRTWGIERLVGGARSVTYFLLGHGRQRQHFILREGALHQDIIQRDFEDTYHNMTLKVLLGLQWLCCSCPSVSFVMKTDSDMFVNTDYLIKLLSRHPHRRNLLTGIIMKGFGPVRENSSKWYISKDEYPRDKYPPYCSGTGFVLSTDLACRMWEVSEKAQKIKIEDVYVGLCLAVLEVEPMKIHSQQVFCSHKVPFSICTYRQLITSHWVRDYEKLLFWRGLQDSDDEKCRGEP